MKKIQNIRVLRAGVLLLLLTQFFWIPLRPDMAPASEGSYPSIEGPCGLLFPRDHGPHPDHKTEWWYYTGHLEAAPERLLGFQLTFFRTAILPAGAEKDWPPSPSAWRTRQIYLAHAAVSDLGQEQFHHCDGVAREAIGMAGGHHEKGVTSIHFRDWSAGIEETRHTLRARCGDFLFELVLTPRKPPTLHGNAGHSIKGKDPRSSSCYYSITRLAAEGKVELKGQTFKVAGSAWMDHEFSSAPLEEDLQGWDWFSLQFTDGTELMIYLMRHPDGSFSPASGGTYVTETWESIGLTGEAVHLEVLDRWRSPDSGALYPSGWRIRIPSLELDLFIQPNMRQQEMRTEGSTAVTYWEGSVSVEGTGKGGSLKTGRGYVELTGYKESMGGRL